MSAAGGKDRPGDGPSLEGRERVRAFVRTLRPILTGEDLPADVAECEALIEENLVLMLKGEWVRARDFERRQWSLPVDMAEHDPRRAFAEGIAHAASIIESSPDLQSAKDALAAVAICTAPVHARRPVKPQSTASAE